MRSVEPGAVHTQHGTVRAGVVVVAVDGRLDVLLPQLAPIVRTARLQMLATAPIALGRVPCPVYGRWGYDYAQQLPDGRLFVGGGRDLFAEDEWTLDAHPTAGVQAYIETVTTRMAGAPDGCHAPVGRVGRLHRRRASPVRRGRRCGGRHRWLQRHRQPRRAGRRARRRGHAARRSAAARVGGSLTPRARAGTADRILSDR